jgi:hypothetical protein
MALSVPAPLRRSGSFASVKILLLAALICFALPAGAVRATASATIVAAADVAALRSDPTVAVSVSMLQAGSYAYVMVAFN